MLMFGRHLTLPADLEFGAPFDEVVRQYAGQYTPKLRQTLWELHELTRRTVRDATLQTKRRYDIKATPVDLRPNDIVWLYNPKNAAIAPANCKPNGKDPIQWSKG